MNPKITKEMHINISDPLKKQFHATCVMHGMKKAIGDKAAIEFSVGFYDALSPWKREQG